MMKSIAIAALLVATSLFSDGLALAQINSTGSFPMAPGLAVSPQVITVVDGKRNFPEQFGFGQLEFGVFPLAKLDGKDVRFSGAGRVHGDNNLIITPASMYQKTASVRYETESNGDIRRAWILTEAEIKVAQEIAKSRK